MSICKVETFYDSIKKYTNVADVTKRAKLEAEYLNKACGSIASLKRYFTMYRNYLKSKIGTQKLIEKQSLLALLLSILTLDEKQQSEFKTAHHAEISHGQRNLRKIYDVEKYLSTAVGLLSAISVYDKILGIAALTGRRPAEIACSAVLAPIANNDYAALFSGQLKAKDRIDIVPYEIPLLYEHLPITKALTSVREARPQFLNKPLLFNSTASGELGVRVKRHFTGLIEGDIQAKNLRAIYALLSFGEFNKQSNDGYVTISMNSYFSKVLGHSENDVVTCGSYIDFCLPTQRNDNKLKEGLKIS
jgi:hypothetical protein